MCIVQEEHFLSEYTELSSNNIKQSINVIYIVMRLKYTADKQNMYIIRICILCRWRQQKTQNVFVQFGSWLCWVHLLLVATKMVPEKSHATTCWSSTQMHHLRPVQILVMFGSIWELVWRVGVCLAPLTLLPMNVVLYMNVGNSMHIYTYSCTKHST